MKKNDSFYLVTVKKSKCFHRLIQRITVLSQLNNLTA